MDIVDCPSRDSSLHELGEDDALVSTGEDVRPFTKRKVDTLNEEDDSIPIRLDGPIHISDLGSVDLDGVLSGEVDHGLGDLDNLNVDDYGVSSSGLDPPLVSQSLDSNLSPSADVLNILSTSEQGGTEGASNLVSGEGTMTHISAPPVDISAITKPILDTIDLVLKNAFEALDTPTLTDSERREIFQAVRSVLPVGDTAPQIAAVRTGWEKFVSISDAVQEARKTVEDQSKQKSEFVTTAESKAESIEASLKTSAAEMSSVLEKHAEKKERVEALSAQLQEANAELLTAGERVKQLESDRSAKQAEAKKLHGDLLEANAKASEELEALKGNISTLENEAESIIGSLKDWHSKSN
ncbi:hypothetical protein CFC21_010648 [Triticum aestivum]|uniref:Uncharacterized protein n=2 Tax=Triticum aestivum TaxID=4565 RepID=A0A3B5ZQL8_WHEAT|nr:hypothetical protein CFC21_010648 [Triticum aestivum]